VARTVAVAVAARDLPSGTTLRASDVRVTAVPAGLAPRGRSPGAAPLTGRVLAAPVRAGEPLTDVRLVGAGLTSLLAEDQVAAPVRLADLAVTAVVRAGDRVDVLATPEGVANAEVVAERALVLAAPTRPGSASVPAGDESSGLLLLAVDAATASRLAAAQAGATVTVTLVAP
jgi:pilus assembly protein CpaB